MPGLISDIAATAGLASTHLIETESAGGTSEKATLAQARNAMLITSASNPAVTDDSGDGYAAGCVWLNTSTGVLWVARSVSVGAAVWYPITPSRMPLISGNYYQMATVDTTSTGAVGADLIFATPFRLDQRTTIDQIVFRTNTAVVGNIKVGIYADSNGRPGARVAIGDAPGDTNTAATSTVITVTPSVTLEPGWYWGASLFNASANIQISTAANGSLTSALLGSTNSSNALSGVTGVATYAGGLPSTFGTASDRTANSPLLRFRVA